MKSKLFLFKKNWLCNVIGMMNGRSGELRKEFVHQMQNVKIDTIRNSVDNGITFIPVISSHEMSEKMKK